MEGTKRCPYCGEEILAVARKCKHCGEWLDKEEPKKEEKKMVACPVCGEDIEEGTEVCPYCHERVNACGSSKAEPVAAKKKMVPCPVCGEDIEDGTEVCPYCHEHVGQEKSKAQEQPTPQPQPQAPAQPAQQTMKQQPSQPAHTTQPTPQTDNSYNQPTYGQGGGGYDNDYTEYEDEEEHEGLFLYYYFDVFFKHYADFSGKLPLKRFWLAYLYNVLCMVPFASLDFAIFGFPIVFTNIYGLALLIPSIAFCVRRLHDTGKSGWYYLLGLIPFVGPIILLVLLCQSGEEQTGRAYAVTKDYVMFAVIGVATLLFMIIGFATMSSRINEMKKLFGGSNPYTSITEDATTVDDDETLAWGDEDAESESSDGVSDEEGKDFITMFYQYYWGEKEYDKGNRESTDDALIDDFCTAKMRQKARDEYNYGYYGPESEKPYAVWIFRSGAQDGLGDSRLVDVESSGDGTFIANILDMGHEAKLKMKLVKENGEIKIDDVELLSVVEHW